MVQTESSAPKSKKPVVDELHAVLKAAPGTLYAILDACDEPSVPAKVRELGEQRAVSLYRGSAEEEYWAIAPYLACVDEDLLGWIVDNLWNAPWGVFAVAQTDLAGLRKHFRRFLMVEALEGRQVYFRFYDPRVLPRFVQTCTAGEAEQFFGPIEGFFVTTDQGGLERIGRGVPSLRPP